MVRIWVLRSSWWNVQKSSRVSRPKNTDPKKNVQDFRTPWTPWVHCCFPVKRQSPKERYCLVVEPYPSEQYEFVSWDYYSHILWKKMFQTTNNTVCIYIYYCPLISPFFSFLASQTAKGLCQNMDGLPLPTSRTSLVFSLSKLGKDTSWRNSWLHHGSPRGYPPVVKHGNRTLSIHRWYSHSHLHLLGGFPLPRLSTARSVYFQTSPSRLRTIFSHIPRAPRASESHGRHSQSQATLTRKWMQLMQSPLIMVNGWQQSNWGIITPYGSIATVWEGT